MNITMATTFSRLFLLSLLLFAQDKKADELSELVVLIEYASDVNAFVD